MITILRGIKRMNSAALIFQTESLICPAKVKETIYAPGDIRTVRIVLVKSMRCNLAPQQMLLEYSKSLALGTTTSMEGPIHILKN